MSKILELAKTFEENSKQQASDIETSVNSEFEKHEQAILGALRSSNQSLIAAIDGQSRRWGWLVLKGWLCTLIGVVLMLAFISFAPKVKGFGAPERGGRPRRAPR